MNTKCLPEKIRLMKTPEKCRALKRIRKSQGHFRSAEALPPRINAEAPT